MNTAYIAVNLRIVAQVVVGLSICGAGLLGRDALGVNFELLAPGQRVVFLGDSITDAGGYIGWLDSQFFFVGTGPEYQPPQLINLGLPSETCCGLSEPTHPFPRPNVQERLDRVLQLAEPDVVYACYGMNDGIYHPFDEARFEKYKQGIRQIITKCKAADVKIVLLTPPPFDSQPLRKQGKLAKLDADVFSWRTPYEDYNEVMRRYAEWLLTLRDEADDVIDLFHPIETYVAERRSKAPNFALSEDGVHLNGMGHQLIANAIFNRFGSELRFVEPAALKLFEERQRVTHAAWVTKVGHKRPGVKPGLPLLEAAAARAEITKQIELLAGKDAADD